MSYNQGSHLCRETGMEIAIQSSDELEQQRTRLRKMTDAQLVSFGRAARSVCRDPKCPEVLKRQLEEAKTGGGAGTRKRSDKLEKTYGFFFAGLISKTSNVSTLSLSFGVKNIIRMSLPSVSAS